MDDAEDEFRQSCFDTRRQHVTLFRDITFSGTMEREMMDLDMVDLYEQMLYERAAKGIRPLLYISSLKDFECSILMLLDEAHKGQLALQRQQTGYRARGPDGEGLSQ